MNTTQAGICPRYRLPGCHGASQLYLCIDKMQPEAARQGPQGGPSGSFAAAASRRRFSVDRSVSELKLSEVLPPKLAWAAK